MAKLFGRCSNKERNQASLSASALYFGARMSESGAFYARFEEACVPMTVTLSEAVQTLSKSGSLITCLVDDQKVLVGILTDADVRKSLLKGAKLEDPAIRWANRFPQLARMDLSTREIRQFALATGKREVPIVDQHGRIVDIFVQGLFDTRLSAHEVTADQARGPVLPNAAFILAGGKGMRLRPIVSDRPKPLATVGDKPLIEILMDQLILSGVRKYYVSVNYMANQIEAHFRHPKYDGLELQFVRESEPLGTAGSISYIKDEVAAPLLVCNADVLSNLPFAQVLYYHASQEADITCIVRPHRVTIPYGVFNVEGHTITGIQEKPEFGYLINAGIYVLSSEICKTLQEGQYRDMPSVVTEALAARRRVVPFYLHEYWIDIGRPEDYHKANEEFRSIFGEQK